jgi:2-polyprenyl-3-methyl-5-hydroxy-6-metoxy-1,4-benzoquinol methylase
MNRFEFGKNWLDFLNNLSEDRIKNSENSLLSMLEIRSLEEMSFLDIGSGSGLSSLVAKRAGAKVHSFDYDINSVECTKELKKRYYNSNTDWKIEQGSILDEQYCKSLGQFDIVYSWGVLHHTGNMYGAMKNSDICLKKGGYLFIAIYNDQRLQSRIWKRIKKTYVQVSILRPFIILLGYILLWMPFFVKDLFKLNPFKKWREYKKKRGMSPHHDVIDWVGGYPFEVAKPEEIIHYYLKRGYELKRLNTCGGRLGCNEFVFKKN